MPHGPANNLVPFPMTVGGQPVPGQQTVRRPAYGEGKTGEAKEYSRLLNRGTLTWSATSGAVNGFKRTPNVGSPTSIGVYDLRPYEETPASVGGQSFPEDWQQVTRKVPSGRLLMNLALRNRDSGTGLTSDNLGIRRDWAAIARHAQLALIISAWQTWPFRFASPGFFAIGAGQQDPGFFQRRWGPELMSELVMSGTSEIDLAAWAPGARFVTGWLAGWHKDITFDNSLDFPLTRHAVATAGQIMGRAPRIVSVDNQSGSSIDFLVEVLHGTASSFIGPITVASGAGAVPGTGSAILASLAPGDFPTAINVYAANATAGLPDEFAITFSGG